MARRRGSEGQWKQRARPTWPNLQLGRRAGTSGRRLPPAARDSASLHLRYRAGASSTVAVLAATVDDRNFRIISLEALPLACLWIEARSRPGAGMQPLNIEVKFSPGK